MKLFFKVVFLLISLQIFAQEVPNFQAVDSLYREDQFYFGVTYNILQNRVLGVSQNSFSAGVMTGFLRDFPINKKRTFAIAPGLGLSFNNFKENLVVDNASGTIDYSTIPVGQAFDKNKLAMYALDLPIEFRWRNSTPESHKFWRIYSGFKASYVFLSKSKYADPDKKITVTNNPDLNKIQYGVYLTTGYNSWNLYAYYGFQNFFKKPLEGHSKEFTTLNVGLMFYIL